MNSRNLLNLALFLFILVLVTFVVLEPGKDKPITPPKLTQLSENNIQQIKITLNNNDQNIELKKINNVWKMLKPYALPANSFRIESLNKLAGAISLSQNDLSGLKPKEFGLDPPVATVTFNNKIKIEFGHNKSLKHHRYVKIDSVLHMIADTFYYQLIAKPESFIDHSVLPQNSKIEKLVLPDITFTKNESDWSASPKTKNFSADAANQLMDEWQLSQAYDIEVKNPEANTKADITIQLSDKKLYRFKIKENKENFILSNIDTGVNYILSRDRKEKLLTLTSIESNEDAGQE